MEKAIAKADRALEPIQGLSSNPILDRCIVTGIVCLMLHRRLPSAGVLQLADVTVAFIVHFPCFTKDPASFDISCYRKNTF